MDAQTRALQLQTLLDQTSACVAATDETGRLTIFSPALQELFGQPFSDYPEADLPEQFGLYDVNGLTLLAPEDVPITRARRGEVVVDAAITAKVPGRGLLHLVCNGAPLRDDDGHIRGAVLVVKDVTAEHNAVRSEIALRTNAMQVLDHEFRTSLTILLAHVELLRDLAPEFPDTAQRPLDTVQASAWRLRNLVQTISDLVELDSDSWIRLTVCELGDLVTETVAQLEEYAARRRISLRCRIEGQARTELDVAKVRMAARAMIQNAITYAPTGTEVEVNVIAEADLSSIEVRDRRRDVSSDDDARRLCEIEGADVTRADDGRSLGLAIARTIALAHGGSLELTGEHPSGLRAALVLPRQPDRDLRF